MSALASPHSVLGTLQDCKLDKAVQHGQLPWHCENLVSLRLEAPLKDFDVEASSSQVHSSTGPGRTCSHDDGLLGPAQTQSNKLHNLFQTVIAVLVAAKKAQQVGEVAV